MPKEFLLHVENQPTQLSEIERVNIAFSLEIKRKLKEAVPNASDIPIVYIGSGGDLLSALLVSGSKRIVLVDRHPFLTKDGSKSELSETYSSVDEMLKAIDLKQVLVGTLTHWQSVRPAIQMISHLEKIGIPRRNIDIRVDGKNADIQIHLDGQTIQVNFRSRRVESLSELQSLLRELSLHGDYGLMAKGGGSSAIQSIITQSEGNKNVGPKYFVTDDPRHQAARTLNAIDEKKMYPGYSLIEKKSLIETNWGYSWGEEPSSKTAQEEKEFDYQTRAVIGVLKK